MEKDSYEIHYLFARGKEGNGEEFNAASSAAQIKYAKSRKNIDEIRYDTRQGKGTEWNGMVSDSTSHPAFVVMQYCSTVHAMQCNEPGEKRVMR